ncbi:MAG: DNA repair protein RecO, partial [Dehalococcoidia bacterium]|nr:DNA repair protein RecO [Dehalococcoidia bacterium]
MSQPPRVYKTPGIVLRQRRLGDTDKIITLYTAERGKLDAVAKGVRRVTSRLAGHVEPLNHGSYMFARGRNLDIITQAQTIETFQPLRDDLAPLSRALYAAELLDRATEEREENFALYRLLLDTLRRLSQGGDLDLALRFFEMALLGQLGYRPEIERCVVCQRPLEAGQQAWAPGAGGAVCSSCRPTDVTLRPLSVNALRVLRLLQRGEFRDVASLQVTAELAGELERHLREAIHFALERDIRSAAFLDAV